MASTWSTSEQKMRQFQSGAIRNLDSDKLDYEGFLSPRVLKRYAEYMHKHRFTLDGKMRASDNWQLGISKEAYMKSLWRHFMDMWLHHRGLSHLAVEPFEEAVCGLKFNTDGYLHEVLKEKEQHERIDL